MPAGSAKPPVRKSPVNESMDLLSRLLLRAEDDASATVAEAVKALGREEFERLVALAGSNHVLVRGLEAILRVTRDAGDDRRTELAETALAAERARISAALPVLREVCQTLVERGCDVAVIKSLDHWPDLGSDLDLYTNARARVVLELMKSCFQAKRASRSWGDRLAGKWNFLVPGLREPIEIHVGRLGQTGEQVAIASWLMSRTRSITVGGQKFRVPSISDRLMISTLQRMYRHFYFRLCDIVDTVRVAETEGIDFTDLRSRATVAGIWEGVATYLVIVSDYVKEYRGRGLELPQSLVAAPRFGGDSIFYARGFLRVPILPQSASLYRSQLLGTLRRLELHNGARLSLLPWLATAAVVGQKITGSDKGIW
jgi:hypothetical protein